MDSGVVEIRCRMLGLAVGNPLAAWITSKWGIGLWNAIAGAVLEVLISGLMTRWTSGASRAEAVVELIFLGADQGAVMSGLLLSAQAAVEPVKIGIVTGLIIFLCFPEVTYCFCFCFIKSEP
jgi:hypothetical protein